MKRNEDVQISHDLLKSSSKSFIMNILDDVNLTDVEKDLVISTELQGLSMYDVADKYNIAYVTSVKKKKKAMLKIAKYIKEIC